MFGIASLLLILLAFIHLRLVSIENAYFMALHGIGGDCTDTTLPAI